MIKVQDKMLIISNDHMEFNLYIPESFPMTKTRLKKLQALMYENPCLSIESSLDCVNKLFYELLFINNDLLEIKRNITCRYQDLTFSTEYTTKKQLADLKRTLKAYDTEHRRVQKSLDLLESNMESIRCMTF